MNLRFIKAIIVQIYMFICLIQKYYKLKNNKNNISQEDIYNLVKNHANKSIKSFGVKIEVNGTENLPKDTNVLFIANHSNWVDGIILAAIVDRPTGMIIAKEANWEKFKIIDRWLKMFNCIYMDRKNTREGLKSIQKATDLLKNTTSIGVFPEGLVTQSEKLQEFKHGTFRMALKSGVSIVPIVIKNSKDIYVKTGRWYGKLNKGKVTVDILPCITEHINNTNIKTKEIACIAYNLINEDLLKDNLKKVA